MSTRFKLNINLDDEIEAHEFLRTYSSTISPTGRRLAKRLGLAGRGSCRAAKALWNYAMNRNVAFTTRREGRIETALQYEGICDRIYAQSIQPFVECW